MPAVAEAARVYVIVGDSECAVDEVGREPHCVTGRPTGVEVTIMVLFDTLPPSNVASGALALPSRVNPCDPPPGG